MPKMKTHKGTKKRFRITGTGKAKHRPSGTTHRASRMCQKRKRHLRGSTVTAECDTKRIRTVLGRYSR